MSMWLFNKANPEVVASRAFFASASYAQLHALQLMLTHMDSLAGERIRKSRSTGLGRNIASPVEARQAPHQHPCSLQTTLCSLPPLHPAASSPLSLSPALVPCKDVTLMHVACLHSRVEAVGCDVQHSSTGASTHVQRSGTYGGSKMSLRSIASSAINSRVFAAELASPFRCTCASVLTRYSILLPAHWSVYTRE